MARKKNDQPKQRTINRKVFFYRVNAGVNPDTGEPNKLNFGPAVNHLSTLPFTVDGRYLESDDGISTLAEGQSSDTTIMALAGHVSKKMMERYSHTRNERKREAISIFDKAPSQALALTPQPKAKKAPKNDTRQNAYYQKSPQPKARAAGQLM